MDTMGRAQCQIKSNQSSLLVTFNMYWILEAAVSRDIFLISQTGVDIFAFSQISFDWSVKRLVLLGRPTFLRRQMEPGIDEGLDGDTPSRHQLTLTDSRGWPKVNTGEGGRKGITGPSRDKTPGSPNSGLTGITNMFERRATGSMSPWTSIISVSAFMFMRVFNLMLIWSKNTWLHSKRTRIMWISLHVFLHRAAVRGNASETLLDMHAGESLPAVLHISPINENLPLAKAQQPNLFEGDQKKKKKMEPTHRIIPSNNVSIHKGVLVRSNRTRWRPGEIPLWIQMLFNGLMKALEWHACGLPSFHLHASDFSHWLPTFQTAADFIWMWGEHAFISGDSHSLPQSLVRWDRKFQTEQSVSSSLSTLWLPVCGSRLQAHWFPLKMSIF